MSENKAQPEPSLQELRSTISRLDAAKEPDAPATEEALELTQAVGEDGTVRPVTPAAAAAERIVPPATAAATAAAFGQLADAENQRRRAGELPLGGGDRTLEDVVRDMMRPMLQAWLDQHLAGLVERLVREEIARLAGDTGRH